MKFLSTDIAITGGNGFIGTNLQAALRGQSKSFDIIDIELGFNVNTLAIDVNYRLPKLEHKHLVHLAAQTNIRASLKSPRNTIINNICGLLNCLNALKQGQVEHLTFTSSASSLESSSPYLASKNACESICKAYQDSFGLSINILKLSSVYGPHSVHKDSVIHKFIRQALERKPLTVIGDGSAARDFVYVDDVVNAILYGPDGYISTGRLTKVIAIAYMVAELSKELTGFCPEIIHLPMVQGEVHTPEVHSDLIAFTNIDEGLVKTFEWYMGSYK